MQIPTSKIQISYLHISELISSIKCLDTNYLQHFCFHGTEIWMPHNNEKMSISMLKYVDACSVIYLKSKFLTDNFLLLSLCTQLATSISPNWPKFEIFTKNIGNCHSLRHGLKALYFVDDQK
jgi:hypothetical protein